MADELIPFSPQDAFRPLVMEACLVLSASRHTRRAYWGDAQHWLDFCRRKRVDPAATTALMVAAWVESMKRANLAPKTCNRRLSALASIYDWLRRNKRGSVDSNPFSASEGPKRETAHAIKPTPIAERQLVAAALRLCEADDSFEGMRDAAILRILWGTGARRSSLVAITRERLQVQGEALTCAVPAKRGKTVRLWIAGRAAKALTRWLGGLDSLGLVTGPVFRMSTGTAMTERDVWRAVKRRGRQAGGELTPHSFRVAFLTLTPATLDERQDAAGHSDPKTTRLYDREWKGKAAFVLMPEVEDF